MTTEKPLRPPWSATALVRRLVRRSFSAASEPRLDGSEDGSLVRRRMATATVANKNQR